MRSKQVSCNHLTVAREKDGLVTFRNSQMLKNQRLHDPGVDGRVQILKQRLNLVLFDSRVHDVLIRNINENDYTIH